MILFINILLIYAVLSLLFIPAHKKTFLNNWALMNSFIIFIATILLLKLPLSSAVYVNSGSFNLIKFPSFIINYSYMLDNISIFYIILSTLLGCITAMLTRNLNYRLKENHILLFIIQFLLFNCFITQEIVLFYLFFEAILIPVYLIIGVWGSQRDKIFAANQFFIYTLLGSFIMLTGIVTLFLINGTTNIFILKGYNYTPDIENLLFILFFFSFCIKVPMFPFHLWLPKAHVEAPTAGSVLLAGILLKLGSYGFIRFLLFLFPSASLYFMPIILSISIISIVLSSFTVLRQIDLKRIIAYSSVAHMNFLVCAIFVKDLIALSGSLLLQIAHGLSSSALFLIIGFLYDRYKSRNIFYYRGLVTIMPFFTFFFFMFSLANLGFPSTVNFVSEILIFVGIFAKVPSIAMLTLFGIFLSAIYSFTLLTRVAFGPASPFIRAYYDLSRREVYILTPLLFLVMLLGFFPSLLTDFWVYQLSTWFCDISISN